MEKAKIRLTTGEEIEAFGLVRTDLELARVGMVVLEFEIRDEFRVTRSDAKKLIKHHANDDRVVEAFKRAIRFGLYGKTKKDRSEEVYQDDSLQSQPKRNA